MSILVIAEHDNRQLKPATLNTVAAAQLLSDDITVLVVGFQCQAVANETATINGVKKVIIADNVQYANFLAENMTQLLLEIVRNYNYVLMAATTFGKNCLPRLAACLDVAPISDVIKIINNDTFVRPIYAGNAFATVQLHETKKLISIRSTAFPKATMGQTQAPIEKCELVFSNTVTNFVSHELTQSARPELTNATIVVSGGRGLQNAENFKLLEPLADVLNAAIGASRAAVDAGYVSNDYQVGQTGKIVAPNLYIAIGISGAIQHLAGMKDSKVIVAINKDPDAPIFQIADYGLVADLFTVIPELVKALQNK